jgi:hypothetical protein
MPVNERKYNEALNVLFEYFALKDQRDYYIHKVKQNRDAAAQVNRIRAFFSFLAGMSSALAGLIVVTALPSDMNCSTAPDVNSCNVNLFFVSALVIISVVAPAIGAAFTTLADLFQWDRQVDVYIAALNNINKADALSPLDEMPDDIYKISLQAFAQGTLSVMNDEQAQWGQLIRTPQSLEKFIEDSKRRSDQTIAAAGGAAPEDPPNP